MAETHAAKQAIWMKQMLQALSCLQPDQSIELLLDNQSAVKLAHNPQFHARTKHIDLANHFIRECVSDSKINLNWVPSEEMVADGLTKALPGPRHVQLMALMGLWSVSKQNDT